MSLRVTVSYGDKMVINGEFVLARGGYQGEVNNWCGSILAAHHKYYSSGNGKLQHCWPIDG